MADKPNVWVIYYSMYGHIKKMADSVKAGLEEGGANVKMFQVAETLPEEVLGKMHAAPKPSDPIIDPHTLPEADGFVFGFPTRFGGMPAQFKAFLDATGGHWQKQSLAGKPCGIFTSTASQVGGQETTILTAITNLAHHGMVFVPAGYAAGAPLFDVENVRGGGPFGAGCIAGPDGSRQPSEAELTVAKVQGKSFAAIARKLKAA